MSENCPECEPNKTCGNAKPWNPPPNSEPIALKFRGSMHGVDRNTVLEQELDVKDLVIAELVEAHGCLFRAMKLMSEAKE